MGGRPAHIVLLAVAAVAGAPAAVASGATPNDPEVPRQTTLDPIGARAAWDLQTDASRVTVAIVDDGVDPEQADIAPNLDPGAGYDFGENDGDATSDDSIHGNQVAAILGARGNNGVGMAGLAWNVRLVSVKVRHAGDGGRGDQITSQAEAQGFAYAARIGARVANASFSGPLRQSSAVLAAVAGAPSTLFVVSAGNNASDNDVGRRYPCDLQAANLICVAGTGAADRLWNLSNFGAQSVDLAAPAEQVRTLSGVNTYAAASGTSFAAPMVSATAALYFARYPFATVADARNAILSSVERLPALAGKVVTGGRLHVARALGTPPLTPAPTGPAPPAGPAPALQPVGASGPRSGRSRTAATFAARRRQRLATVLRRGVSVSVTAPVPTNVRVVVRVAGRRAARLGLSAVVGATGARRVVGRRTIRVKLRRAAILRIRRLRSLPLHLQIRAGRAGSPATRRRSMLIRLVR